MRANLHLTPCGSEFKPAIPGVRESATVNRYRLQEGSVVHVDGIPVRVNSDVEIETATDLVKAIEDFEANPVS